jgi:hypothetical protein
LHIGRVDSQLAGFEVAIQDFHACRDVIFDHDVI